MREVFEVSDRKWRGIGPIAAERLRLREEFAAFDAERVFESGTCIAEEPQECISALVLQGLKKPVDCSGVRHALHADDAAGRADGFDRRRLRRLLPIQTPCLKPCLKLCVYSVRLPGAAARRDRVVLGHGSGGS